MAALSAFGAGVYVGNEYEEGQNAKLEAAAAKAGDAASVAAAKQIAKIRITNTHQKQVLEREIHNIPSGTCVLNADGLSAINEILTNGGPGNRQLPAADGAH